MPCECFPCSVLNVGCEMMMTTKRLTHGNIQNIAWLIYVTCTAFLASTIAAKQSALLTFGSQDRNRITLPDPRVVTCEDVSGDETTRVFSAEGLVDFAHMTIDAARQQLIVGARNHLLRLNLTDLTQLEMAKFAPDNLTVSICIAKGQPKDDCHNYIRVLLVQKDQVFACGTNAFAPQCSWRKVDHLDKVVSWVSGVAKCPYNPHQNATFIMTADNNFYSATVTDFTARDPAIYRMMGPSKYLRTVQYNSRWLNEPDFVSSFEIGEFVYFFFRETAIEYINCGKTVYSRVARICQNDGGGKFLLEDNWTTFLKARLNCSLSGSYPFYFNELQNTYYDDHDQLLYAIFTTSPTSIYGSAVCVYNLTSFDQAFNGPFKYQLDPQSAWNRVPNNSPNLQCSRGAAGKHSPLEMNQSPMQRLLVDAQKFQMMDRAVQPIKIEPLVVAENERFNQIIVDRVNLPKPLNVTVNVLFLATLEGTINKMVVFPSIGSSSPLVCLVEQIQLPCNGENWPIRSMRLDSTQKVMFVGTGDRIYRLPVHRCHRFFTKLQCFYAQDPYCGWSDSASKCLPIGHPNLSSCPVLKTPVDGAFCQWSPWQPCSQVGHMMENSQCSCRMRECDCPTPAYGGRTCTGRKVEVANCTVNGNWSDWSSWSGCSATCGHALKTRTRTCSNPKPRYGGRICVGDEIQFDSCPSVKCQDQLFLVADGHWTSWSDWSVCTTRCGGGHQSRTRTCNSIQPLMGGHRCMGNDREFRTCNHGQCDEVRKFSDWSPWLRINSTKDGYANERFRCVCKASVSDQTYLRPPQIKTLLRQCSPSGEDCETGHLSIPDVDGGWSPWSTWTECDALCGSGAQYRDRQCNSPSPSGSGRECQGHSRELRTCNTHSCQGQWSCWSDYGPCSVSCGQGRKWRKRQCESERPGNYYTQACRGGDLQEVTCTMPPCDGNDDWNEWGPWSGCSYDNVQHRRRNCSIPASSMIPDAVNLCHGSDIESRVCQYGDIEINLDPSLSPPVLTEGQAGSSAGAMVQYYHLIIVGVICFLLGGIVVFIAMIHCHHYVFSSAKDGAACTVAEKCDVVSDFSYFPPVHPFITSSGSIQLDEAVHTATHSSQTALMDFRHYYHPPNT